MPKIPSPRSFVLCSAIEFDAAGAPNLLGILQGLAPSEFPWRQTGLGLFISIGEVGRGADVQVKLFRARPDDLDGDLVAQSDLVHVRAEGPCDEVSIPFLLEDVVFDKPGDFRFVLYANGQYLAERRMPVLVTVSRSH